MADIDKGGVSVNVGVVGHVDAGKTALCAALSEVLSTAALDKNPQSQERGITLDLQFSAFTVADGGGGAGEVRVGLVDCPGHASLIRHIIGAAAIIDLVLLVIDVSKGIQTQTAEGLVVAEVTGAGLLVVLNKVDLLGPPGPARQAHLDKLIARIRKALEPTRFGAQVESVAFIPFAAKPSAPGAQPEGVAELRAWLGTKGPRPARTLLAAPLVVAVDHCFTVKGKGTVATGTVLQGTVRVNDMVEVVHLREQKKIKGLQVFKRPVPLAHQGDRVGMLLPDLKASAMERGLIAAPGAVTWAERLVGTFEMVRYFKQPIRSHSRFHLTIGHTTVMCTVLLFSSEQTTAEVSEALAALAKPGHEARYEAEYPLGTAKVPAPEWVRRVRWWVDLRLDKAIPLPPHAQFIASRLDSDINTPGCRLAFRGAVARAFADPTEIKRSLAIVKTKIKIGEVERFLDDYSLIGRGLFKKETDMQRFAGLAVTLRPLTKDSPSPAAAGSTDTTPESGTKPADIIGGSIEGSFGKTGKFRVRVPSGGLSALAADKSLRSVQIQLETKRNIFDAK